MSEYPELRPCDRCTRSTRPKQRKSTDYPFETVARGTKDLCANCYQFMRKPAEVIPDNQHQNNMRGWLRYLAGRQQRLARAERLTMS